MKWLSACINRAAVVAMTALPLATVVAFAQDDSPTAAEVTLSTPRAGHTATVLDNDYVLIAGGSDGDEVRSSVEEVDPVGGSVEFLGNLSTRRVGHSATLLPDGSVLVAGGSTGQDTLGSAELFDPLVGSSEPVGPMVWPRQGHDALVLPDGSVLLAGGFDEDGPVARAEVFDTRNHEFTKVAKSKATHVDPAAALLPDGRVLLVGSPRKEKGRSAELYSPAKDKWAAVKKAGGDRVGHTASLLHDGRVLLAGGAYGGVDTWSTEVFDPAAKSFAWSGEMSKQRSSHTATVMPDGSVLIVGGSRTSAIEAFDPASGAFTVVGDMGRPRTEHTASPLSDGRLLIAGGRFLTHALDELLIFDPVSGVVAPLGRVPGSTAEAIATNESRTRSDIRASLGPPEAFLIYFFDELDVDGNTVTSSMEWWSYYDHGVAYTFAGDGLVVEERIESAVSRDIEASPYDPDQFSAYMSLDEVTAAAGVDEYLGGPADEVVSGGELYFADQLAWGMKDDELRFIEAGARATEADDRRSQ